jgi:mono/diheme cytochrome c family protein
MELRATSRACAATILVILAGASTTSSALGAGDREAGWHLAQRWCASCHVVDASGYGARMAPAFPAIARERGTDARWLRAWLAAPHPPMPAANLTGAETEDLVAYLESLMRP